MRHYLCVVCLLLGCSAKHSHQEPAAYSSDLICDPTPPGLDNTPPDGIYHYSDEVSSCDTNIYRLEIDRRFLCDTEDQIIAAWKNWASILNNKVEVIVQYPDEIEDSFEACTIKVIRRYTPPEAPGLTAAHIQDNGKPSTARVFLDPKFQGFTLKQAGEHELGHALGLSHIEGNQHDIMAPKTDDPRLQIITCIDKKKLCDIWGCDPGCTE